MSNREWQPRIAPPKPREGDEFTPARREINMARFPMTGLPGARDVSRMSLPEKRAVLADFFRENGVVVPAFVPVVYGWLDCNTGELANPTLEPGANGRRFS